MLTKRVLDVIAQDIAALTDYQGSWCDGIYQRFVYLDAVSNEDYKTLLLLVNWWCWKLGLTQLAREVNILHICGYERRMKTMMSFH